MSELREAIAKHELKNCWECLEFDQPCGRKGFDEICPHQYKRAELLIEAIKDLCWLKDDKRPLMDDTLKYPGLCRWYHCQTV